MKTINRLFYTLALAILCCFASHLSAEENKSPIAHCNFSIWSEYKRNHFDGLTQEEKTEKLQNIFRDKLSFVKKHNIRRLIVKILDPVSFNFFHPEKFNSERDDNFLHWTSQLANHVEIEVLFDSSNFQLCKESLFDRLAVYYGRLRDYFGKQENPFGNFQNIIEKMEWVAWTNELYGAKERGSPLIRGITLDPKGIGDYEIYYQNLVNAFDQFRFQMIAGSKVPGWLPENSFPGLRTAMLLPLDMKDFALANASSFPLSSHLRQGQAGNIGIELPQNFPSSGPDFTPPPWRGSVQTQSLLDTIYLQMSDPRLIPHLYQNYEVLPKPDQPGTDETMSLLGVYLENCFHGIPFVKGPGYITNQKGTSEITGNYTFFQTGSSKGEGQFIPEQIIEIRPPYVSSPISRQIAGVPQTNRKMKVTSTFSTTHSLDNVEYWHAPIPCNWSQPSLSIDTGVKIYFVFSTDYDSTGDRYLGNWNFKNFITLLGWYYKFGLNGIKPFRNIEGKLQFMAYNLVLYDYSTIPNGDPFPDCDWELGNENY